MHAAPSRNRRRALNATWSLPARIVCGVQVGIFKHARLAVSLTRKFNIKIENWLSSFCHSARPQRVVCFFISCFLPRFVVGLASALVGSFGEGDYSAILLLVQYKLLQYTFAIFKAS